jgi:hypothetical protein
MRRFLTWFVATVLCAASVPLGSWAQTTPPGTQDEVIRELLSRIDKLESRVAELESQAPGRTAPPTAAAEPRQAPMTDHSQMPETASGPDVQPTYPSLKIAGFSDVNFAATDQRGTRSGFNEGQFILHMSSALSSRVNYFGEISATARNDAGTGTPPATGFNFEVERSIIRFDQSDYFKASFGRYHTPINWWNTAYHHGQWLQTTISRPEMTQFGGQFIPVHFVGALAEGSLPAGGLNFNYNVGIGNGRNTVISRGGDAGDVNNNRAWLANVFIKPDALFGLQIGGSVYRDKLTLATGREFREWITSGHIVWNREDPEIIAEVANVNHSEVARNTTWNSQAFYVQLAYRLPWFEKLWKPYYRFEYTHIPRTDAVFQSVADLSGSTVGLRYDISSFAAIKAEYRNQRRIRLVGRPTIEGAFLQTSFTF